MPKSRAHVIALEEAVADGMLTKDDVDAKIAPHVNRFDDRSYWADLAALGAESDRDDRKLPSGPVVRATPEAREALHALLMAGPGGD